MSRKYPRFLFSDPQNTKSKGPFVVHLLDPFIVFKVILNGELQSKNTHHLLVELQILNEEVKANPDADQILYLAQEWLKFNKDFINWFNRTSNPNIKGYTVTINF